MTLKEIAAAVLDEDVNRDDKELDGEDGEVKKFVFTFSLDPAVVAEKAKAMGKGVKRDDLSDDLGEAAPDDEEEVYADDVADGEGDDEEDSQIDGDEDDEDPYNGISTEDNAVSSTIFMDALDSVNGIEVVAMDARQHSRHAQTPLENCRAKDPRFCPYHGIPAWKGFVEKELAAAGDGGKVTVTNDNGKFTVTMEATGILVPKLYKEIYDKIAAIDGVRDIQSVSGDFNGPPQFGAQFRTSFSKLDRVGRLKEWANDFVDDYVGDDIDVDTNDFSALMEAQENVENFAASMNEQDPNDVAKLRGLLDDAEGKYHSLIAQQYFSDVTDEQEAADAAMDIESDFSKAEASVKSDIAEVTTAKQAIFGGRGSFPPKNTKKGIPSFEDQHPWVKAYNKALNGIRYSDRDYQNAAMGYAQCSANDIKGMRTALSAMDYMKDNYVLRGKEFPNQKKTFMQSFYDWAEGARQSGGGSYGIDDAKMQMAFPNGRPQ